MSDSQLVREAVKLLSRSRRWLRELNAPRRPSTTTKTMTEAQRIANRIYMREYMRAYRAKNGPRLATVVRIRPGFCSRCGVACEASPCQDCRYEITKEIAS